MDAVAVVAEWSRAFRSLLPDAAWGVLLGAVATLVATLVSNRHARRQLREQLAHDARQAERARLMQLRRDVYLPAAEAITDMFQVIAKLSNPDTDEAAIDVSRFGGTIAKLQMVAGSDAVRLVSMLSTEIGATVLSLTNRRVPLRLLRADSAIANTWYERYVRETEEYLEMMKQFNLAGNTDQHQWNRIKRNLDFSQQHAEEQRIKRDSLVAQQLRLHGEYVKDSFSEFKRLYALVAPALTAIRAELGMPDADATALSDALEYQNRRMGEELEKVISSVSAIAEKIEGGAEAE
jgi:hypothetical protein